MYTNYTWGHTVFQSNFSIQNNYVNQLYKARLDPQHPSWNFLMADDEVNNKRRPIIWEIYTPSVAIYHYLFKTDWADRKHELCKLGTDYIHGRCELKQ